MNYIKIEDYFGEAKSGLSGYDNRKLQELRDTLNGFKTVKEQAEYIKNWRSFKENKEWDAKVLGIDRFKDIDPADLRSLATNKYYSRHESQMDRYFDVNKEREKRERKETAERQKELDDKAKKDKREAHKARQKAEEAKVKAEQAQQEAETAQKELEALQNEEISTEDTGTDSGSGSNTHSDGDSRVSSDDDRSQSFRNRMQREKNSRKGQSKSEKLDEAQRRAQEASERAQKAQEAAEEAQEAAEEAGKAAQASGQEAAEEAGKAAQASGQAAAAEPILIAIAVITVIIVLVNTIIFAAGGLNAMFGKTPFATCETVQMDQGFSINDDMFKKTVERNGVEISLPANVWWYSDKNADWFTQALGSSGASELGLWYNTTREDTGVGAQLEYCFAEESDRGRGVFVAEDYAWNPPHTDPYGVEMNGDAEVWSINMRWEYVNQRIAGLNTYASAGGDLNCPYNDNIQAGTTRPNSGTYWNELMRLKFLVVNPENGKACVCYPGDGNYELDDSGNITSSGNPNWGPAPANRIGGLSAYCMNYLEYTPGNTDKYLEVFIIDTDDPESITAGPYTGISLSNGDGCSGGTLNIIDTTSAANAASSLSWGGFTGTGRKSEAAGAGGVPGYNEFLEENLPGGASSFYGCCASFVGSILWSQGMVSDMTGQSYTSPYACECYIEYMRTHTDEWEEFEPASIDDLNPGDVIFYNYDGSSKEIGDVDHIAIVGAGREDNVFGDGLAWVEICMASREGDNPDGKGYDPNLTSYAAWSHRYDSLPTASGNDCIYFRFIGTGNSNHVNP